MKPLGIGLDLVYLPRFKRLYELYNQRFLQKLFTEEEIEYALKKKNFLPSLASAFAVKEAFYKALGGYEGFSFKEISLLRDPLTKAPSLKLSGKAQEIFIQKGGFKIDLSLSHNFEYVIAIVQVWKGE